MHEINSRGMKRLLLSATFWKRCARTPLVGTFDLNFLLVIKSKLWTLQQVKKIKRKKIKMLLPRKPLTISVPVKVYLFNSLQWRAWVWSQHWEAHDNPPIGFRWCSSDVHSAPLWQKSTGTAVENAGMKLVCNERTSIRGEYLEKAVCRFSLI